jgi:hypothetical protein
MAECAQPAARDATGTYAALAELLDFVEDKFDWAADDANYEGCMGEHLCADCRSSGCIRSKIERARAAIARATGERG